MNRREFMSAVAGAAISARFLPNAPAEQLSVACDMSSGQDKSIAVIFDLKPYQIRVIEFWERESDPVATTVLRPDPMHHTWLPAHGASERLPAEYTHSLREVLEAASCASQETGEAAAETQEEAGPAVEERQAARAGLS